MESKKIQPTNINWHPNTLLVDESKNTTNPSNPTFKGCYDQGISPFVNSFKSNEESISEMNRIYATSGSAKSDMFFNAANYAGLRDMSIESEVTKVTRAMGSTQMGKEFLNSITATDGTSSDAVFRGLTTPAMFLTIRPYPDFRYPLYVNMLQGEPYALSQLFQGGDYSGSMTLNSQNSGNTNFVESSIKIDYTRVLDYTIGVKYGYAEWQAVRSNYGNYGPGLAYKSQLNSIALARASAQMKNTLFLFGEASAGIYGLTTDPNVPKYDAATHFDVTGGDIGALTGNDRYKLLNDILLQFNIGRSLGIYRATFLAMSQRLYRFFFGQFRTTLTDTTVITSIIANNPWLEGIYADPYLDGVGRNNSDVIILSDKSKGVQGSSFIQNLPLTMMNPSNMVLPNGEVQFIYRERLAGFKLLLDESWMIVDGFSAPTMSVLKGKVLGTKDSAKAGKTPFTDFVKQFSSDKAAKAARDKTKENLEKDGFVEASISTSQV